MRAYAYIFAAFAVLAAPLLIRWLHGDSALNFATDENARTWSSLPPTIKTRATNSAGHLPIGTRKNMASLSSSIIETPAAPTTSNSNSKPFIKPSAPSTTARFPPKIKSTPVSTSL